MGNTSAADLLLYAVGADDIDDATLIRTVEAALRGGATMVQLRRKHATTAERIAVGRRIAASCRAAGVPFVVDDDIDAARICADGVHVGQDDVDAARARELLGPDAIVGVSAQTVDQARAAAAAGADYLGVGALVPTATKPEAADVSISELRAICDAVDIPVVGIGGLNACTIPRFAGTGIAGAAVVSAIFAADDPQAATAHLRRLCGRTFVC